MWRKRKPLLPGSSAFKSGPSSTATPGSGGTRRSRIARSLGLSNIEQTGTDSQARTILGAEEEHHHAWIGKAASTDSEAQQPSRSQFWNKVEKVHTDTQEISEAGSASGETQPQNTSGGQPKGAINSPQGMKKNVWEVRKK